MNLFFFFNDTATTEIYTLSLHDALPIFPVVIGSWSDTFHTPLGRRRPFMLVALGPMAFCLALVAFMPDRKSTRLNSSHANISYAVFCLKKKKKQNYRY